MTERTARKYAETRKRAPLPAGLSDLLKAAIGETRKLSRRYGARAGIWHEKARGAEAEGKDAPVCFVCLAGALLAQRVGYAAEDVFEGDMRDDHSALMAVDHARAGYWERALTYARTHELLLDRPEADTPWGREDAVREAKKQAQSEMDGFVNSRAYRIDLRAGAELEAPEACDFTTRLELGLLCAELERMMPAIGRMERAFAERCAKGRAAPA